MKQSDRFRLLAEQLDFADKIQHLVKTGQISRIEAEVRRLKDFATDLLIPKPDFPAGGIVIDAMENILNVRETLARVRRDAEAVPQLVAALRDIHDLVAGEHNAEAQAPDWAEVVARVRELLEKYETE